MLDLPPLSPGHSCGEVLATNAERLLSLGGEHDEVVHALETLRAHAEVLAQWDVEEKASTITAVIEKLTDAVIRGVEKYRPVPEVAEITGYSREHLYQLIHQGKLPRRTAQHQLALSVQEVRRYQRSACGHAPAAHPATDSGQDDPENTTDLAASLVEEESAVARIRRATPLPTNADAA